VGEQVLLLLDHYRHLPQNIINADGSNLRDDSGAKKAFFQREVKYAELVQDHTKSCISIMFASAASCVLLPPYVIYKSQGCYDSWGKEGPRGQFTRASSLVSSTTLVYWM
jgi:hypothetical protein